jgi:hypothetical protein
MKRRLQSPRRIKPRAGEPGSQQPAPHGAGWQQHALSMHTQPSAQSPSVAHSRQRSFASSQIEPSGHGAGPEMQAPPSQCSGPSQNWPLSGQTTGVTAHVPFTHESVIHGSPSSQSAAEQHSATQVSVPSQHTGVDPWQGFDPLRQQPLWQGSGPLQYLPSSHGGSLVQRGALMQQ